MKKILAALALLALVCGFVAAQDGELVFSGHVKSGLQMQQNYNDDGRAFFVPWSDDSGKPNQIRFQIDYKTENSGVSIRLQSNKITKEFLSWNDGFAYGWFSFLNNMVEVSGGKLGNRKWGSYTDFYFDNQLDNRNAVKIVIRPVDGLSFGVNTLNSRISFFGQDDKLTPVDGNEIQYVFEGSVVGVEYKVPDVFGIRAALLFDEKFAYQSALNGGYFGGTPVGFSTKGQSSLAAMFSAFFYGVEGLKVDLDGAFASGKKDEAIGDLDDWTSFALAVNAMYQVMEPLNAGVRFVYENAPAKEKNPSAMLIRPQADYMVTEWLQAGLKIPIAFTSSEYGFDKDGDLKKASVSIGAIPSLAFIINPKTTFVVWYYLEAYTPYGKIDSGLLKDEAGDTVCRNTLQLDFIWKF